MSDYLAQLVGRTLGVSDVLRPRTAAVFEPDGSSQPALDWPEPVERAVAPAPVKAVHAPAGRPQADTAEPAPSLPLAADQSAPVAKAPIGERTTAVATRPVATVRLPESGAARRSSVARSADRTATRNVAREPRRPAPALDPRVADAEPGAAERPAPARAGAAGERPGAGTAATVVRASAESALPPARRDGPPARPADPAATAPPEPAEALLEPARVRVRTARQDRAAPREPGAELATSPPDNRDAGAGAGAGAGADADAEPVVHVHIGRVEVGAPTAPARPARPRARKPLLSLEDYLASGAERRRP